jgi:hypothetical protein
VRLAVPRDVESGDVQQVRVVPEQTEAVVASLAQQPANLARVMIVIKVLRPRLSADGATVALRGAQDVHRRPRHSVIA